MCKYARTTVYGHHHDRFPRSQGSGDGLTMALDRGIMEATRWRWDEAVVHGPTAIGGLGRDPVSNEVVVAALEKWGCDYQRGSCIKRRPRHVRVDEGSGDKVECAVWLTGAKTSCLGCQGGVDLCLGYLVCFSNRSGGRLFRFCGIPGGSISLPIYGVLGRSATFCWVAGTMDRRVWTTSDESRGLVLGDSCCGIVGWPCYSVRTSM